MKYELQTVFDPTQPCWSSVLITKKIDENLLNVIVPLIMEQIEATIPFGYKHKVRCIFHDLLDPSVDPLSETGFISWRYDP